MIKKRIKQYVLTKDISTCYECPWLVSVALSNNSSAFESKCSHRSVNKTVEHPESFPPEFCPLQLTHIEISLEAAIQQGMFKTPFEFIKIVFEEHSIQLTSPVWNAAFNYLAELRIAEFGCWSKSSMLSFLNEFRTLIGKEEQRVMERMKNHGKW
jgi:hypothetical protein